MLSSENPVKDINKMLRYFKDEDAARNTKVNGGSAIEIDFSVKARGRSSAPALAPNPPADAPPSLEDAAHLWAV